MPGEVPHREAVAALTVLVLLLGVGAVVLVAFFAGPGPRPARQGGPRTPASSQPATPGPSAPSGPSGPAQQGGGNGLRVVTRSFPLRVSTANLHAGMSWSHTVSDLSRLVVPGTDVVGLNEVTPGRAGRIAAWVRDRPGWHYYRPSPARSRWEYDDTILWNAARLRLLDSGSIWASPSRTSYRISSRWIAWTEFAHRRSGTHLYYLQTHMDPAVERDGHPRARPAVGANLAYMRKLLRVAGRFARDGVVVIGGDWNVDARADMRVGAASLPYAVLQGRGAGPVVTSYQALGFTVPATSPESGRWIDYLAIWDRFPPGAARVEFTAQSSDTDVFSDHDPLTADLALEVPTLEGLDRLRTLRGQSGRMVR